MLTYKLQFPSCARIHDVFHVSLINKFEDVARDHVVPLSDLLHDKVVPSPEEVLRARMN